MPDWLPGIIIAAIAAIPAIMAIIQGRREAQVKVKEIQANVNGLVASTYKSLVNDLREESKSKDQIIRMKDEEIKNLKAQLDVEHEQRVHAETYLTIKTAKLAAYEGRKLTNSEAEE